MQAVSRGWETGPLTAYSCPSPCVTVSPSLSPLRPSVSPNDMSSRSLEPLSLEPRCPLSVSPLHLPGGRALRWTSFPCKPLEGRDNVKVTAERLPPESNLHINVHLVNEYASQRIPELS